MSDESSQVPHSTPPVADPQSIEGLFITALGHSTAEERNAFLDEACGDDLERRRRIEALLRAYEDAGSFLDKPPLDVGEVATLSLDFLAPSDDPSLLGMLDQYEVYEVLGRGGMGIVFRARDPKLNRVVAIKVLAPELAANPNARRRFLREAQAAAAISHPHVVTIHAVDEGSIASGTPAEQTSRGAFQLPYLVMECIVGQTLQQKLDKQGSLRLMEILRIGQQTAQGLAAAHKQGLIHRDIKPANILLENGVERVKITDFGLARAVDDVSITRTGEVSGTPQYMSPEQAQGENVDHRSDLFSLGSVLYAMCTGRSPFRATTLAAAIRRVCDDTPRPIEEINPEVPGWMCDIVNRLLAKNPDQRIQTAEEVEQVLGEHLAGVQQPVGRRAKATSAPPAPERRLSPTVPTTAQVGAVADMPRSVRILLWIGCLTLLVPLFVLLFGFAIGPDHDAIEAAVISAFICVPLAVAMLAISLSDRYWKSNDVAGGLFLLLCILLGPIGILLYMMRTHHHQQQPEHLVNQPAVTATHVSRESSAPPASEMPAWLLTPMPGLAAVAKIAVLAGVALMLFVFARLVQIQDQFAFPIAAGVGILGLIYYAAERSTERGPVFRLWQLALVLFVIFGGLMTGSPDGMYWFSTASGEDLAIMAILGVLLVIAGLIASTISGGSSRLQTNRRDPLGRTLIFCGLFVWAALAAYGLLAGAQLAPPLRLRGDAAAVAEAVMMALVLLGGVLFGLGMWLQRRLVTPGMVRQVALAHDSAGGERRENDSVTEATTTSRSPWRVLGWMAVGCVTLLLGMTALYLMFERVPNPPLILELPPGVEVQEVTINGSRGSTVSAGNEVIVHKQLPAGHPATVRVTTRDGVIYTYSYTTKPGETKVLRVDRAQMKADYSALGLVRITYADEPPFTWVRRGSGTSRIGESPYHIALPPGEHALTFEKPPDGSGESFTQIIDVPDARTTVFYDLDQRKVTGGDVESESDADASSITEDYAGDVEMMGGGLANASPAPAQGAVILTIADTGLGVRFVPVLDESEEQGHSSAGEFGSGTQMAGGGRGFGGAAGMGMGMGMDSYAGGSGGGYPPSAHFDSGTYKLNEGTYSVEVIDSSVGWTDRNDFGSPTTTIQLPEPIEIVAGEFQKLTVHRDLKAINAQEPDWDRRGFFGFNWTTGSYDLSKPQAIVVQRLLTFAAADQWDVDRAILLLPDVVDVDATMTKEKAAELMPAIGAADQSLEAIFNDGQHPAWGTLIVPGESADTYRLAAIPHSEASPAKPEPQGTLNLTFIDGGLSAFVEEKSFDVWTRLRPTYSDDSSVVLSPGNYRITVQDDLAGWRGKTKYDELDVVTYEFEVINLAAGETIDLTIDRNFFKIDTATPHLSEGSHHFLWQGNTYELNEMQSLAVTRLLKATAKESPEVHEGFLVGPAEFRRMGSGVRLVDKLMTTQEAEEYREKLAADGKSLKSEFNDGQHPAWGTLIVPGEAEHTYRLAELKSPPVRKRPAGEPKDEESRDGADFGGRSAAPMTIDQDNGVYTTVTVEDDGMLVALRRISVFDGTRGPEKTVNGRGGTTFQLQPGDYELLTRDRLFGWGDLIMTITIGDDMPENVTVRRDLAEHVGRAPKQLTKNGFLWDGQSYFLRLPFQSSVVSRLLDAYVSGEPSVSTEELIRTAEEATDKESWDYYKSETIEELFAFGMEDLEPLKTSGFAEKSAIVPFGNLIVPGETAGTYRLAPLVRGTLVAEGTDAGMSVTIKPVKKDLRFSGTTLVGGESVEIPPGEYICQIEDGNVVWGRGGNRLLGGGGFITPYAPPVRKPNITITEGESASLDVSRHWQDYLEPEPPAEDGTIAFQWFPDPESQLRDGFGMKIVGTMEVDRRQQRVILVLLKALSDGNPEVPEDDLLTQAEITDASFAELFPDPQNESVVRWKTVIVPGEAEGTWRLRPPPATADEE